MITTENLHKTLMTLHIHDTLSGQKVPFEPTNPDRVTMYVCGPTVYNYAHIGNARPVVVFDVLFRLLRHLYGEDKVVYARNITDVDDKINKKAIDEGVDISVITNKFADIYNADMAALNALPPTFQPRATDHMLEMVAMIEDLITRGAAYVTDDGEVLFRVAEYDAGSGRYGRLAKRSLDDMIAGARVEVAENKDNAADFVLWKPSKPGEPVWPGPPNPSTGKPLPGRPGWHIECSAMSEAVLQLPIDIHGGGQDLIFPHHTNEIAQSCAAHGHDDPAAYAKYWMHNGFLDFSGEKMSKSLGNVVLVHDLIKDYPGEVIRLALLSAHYRAPLNWTPGLLVQMRRALDRLYQLLRDLQSELVEFEYDSQKWSYDVDQLVKPVLDVVCDDLNTPGALAAIYDIVRVQESSLYSVSSQSLQAYYDSQPFGKRPLLKAITRDALVKAGAFLGILQQDPEDWFKKGADVALTEKAAKLIKNRQIAKNSQDWLRADRLRNEAARHGILLEDNNEDTSWKKYNFGAEFENITAKALMKFGASVSRVENGIFDLHGRFNDMDIFVEAKVNLSTPLETAIRLLEMCKRQNIKPGKAYVVFAAPSKNNRTNNFMVDLARVMRAARHKYIGISVDAQGEIDRLS